MGRHKSSTKTPFSTPATKRFCPSYFSTAEKSEISKPPSVERKLMAASLSEASQSRRSLRQSFWPITGQRIDTPTSAAVYPGGETIKQSIGRSILSFAGEICDRHNLHPLGALVWKRCKIHDLELEGIELALRKRKSGRRRD
jgi:hypothetical protein